MYIWLQTAQFVNKHIAFSRKINTPTAIFVKDKRGTI